jgi:hypothetical protein
MTDTEKINARLNEMEERAASKYGKLALQDEYGQWLLQDLTALIAALRIEIEYVPHDVQSCLAWDKVERRVAEALEGKP